MMNQKKTFKSIAINTIPFLYEIDVWIKYKVLQLLKRKLKKSKY